ncbi:selenoprotein F [Arctopsyche grandis]|uniref:selenoprotein F n=1 Tax=Arctopsyche grandis TaxID=121162 RepID=UPI00406DA449
MTVSGVFYLASFLLLLTTGVSSDPDLSSDDCLSQGFDKANLLCSWCDQLKEFGLERLVDSCRKCCQRDDTVEPSKFARAVLEVCTCKFAAYPQIQAFVKSDRPAKFSNLQIRYGHGLDPAIKLLDKDGSVKQVVAIEKWDTDTVEEFLNTHLVHEDDDESKDYLKTNRI